MDHVRAGRAGRRGHADGPHVPRRAPVRRAVREPGRGPAARQGRRPPGRRHRPGRPGRSRRRRSGGFATNPSAVPTSPPTAAAPPSSPPCSRAIALCPGFWAREPGVTSGPGAPTPAGQGATWGDGSGWSRWGGCAGGRSGVGGCRRRRWRRCATSPPGWCRWAGRRCRLWRSAAAAARADLAVLRAFAAGGRPSGDPAPEPAHGAGQEPGQGAGRDRGAEFWKRVRGGCPWLSRSDAGEASGTTGRGGASCRRAAGAREVVRRRPGRVRRRLVVRLRDGVPAPDRGGGAGGGGLARGRRAAAPAGAAVPGAAGAAGPVDPSAARRPPGGVAAVAGRAGRLPGAEPVAGGRPGGAAIAFAEGLLGVWFTGPGCVPPGW